MSIAASFPHYKILRKLGKWVSRILGRRFKSPRDTNPVNVLKKQDFRDDEIITAISVEGETIQVDSQRIYLRGKFENTNFVMERFYRDFHNGSSVFGPARTSFHHCEFINCSFRVSSDSGSIDFFKSTLEDCHFDNAPHTRLIFQRCDFRKTHFASPAVHEFRLRTSKGFETCTGIETIEFQDPSFKRCFERDLEATPLPLGHRCFSWGKLRGFGTLPFFGFSYAGTALILFFLSVVDHYNVQVNRLKGKADVNETLSVLESLVDRLSLLSLNWQIPTLLAGTILLMFASTIYAWTCPDRIKEFSLERWTKELGQDAFKYVPLTWHNPILRVICGLCFWAGSGLTASVLIWRLGQGFSQALRNW
ncbi:MAG: hypothetical protein ACK5V0_01085 [Alphaproteobacteria bacterium]|jgi:uncharacterized protein YjbI with pentapeptide repeats